MTVLLNSSLVVWRESFEAMLVVYLIWNKLKNESSFSAIKKSIVSSVILGLIVSVVFGAIAMSSQDLFDSETLGYLQGFLPIIAAGLMMQMLVWMSQHSFEVKTKISQIGNNKNTVLISVFMLILITLSREGFETVVFLSGLAMSINNTKEATTVIGSGIVIGTLLSLLTVGFMSISKRFLNLSLFFLLTNLVLLYIAAEMIVVGSSQLIDLSILPVIDVIYLKWAFIALGLILLRHQLFYSVPLLFKNQILKKLCILAVVVFFSSPSKADLNFIGYGVFDYRQFQTFKSTNNYDPYFREQFDLTEFAIEAEYLFENGNELEFEIEIEHGGTGTAYEFEPLEEFGEFESEVEKGGEVVLSEFSYFKRFNKSTGLRIGKFPLMIGLGSIMTNPNNNISIKPSHLEQNMIPVGWNEIGIQLEHKWQDLRARLALVNGLNSEFFRTYNWIGGGYQRHFEEINAEGKAFVTTLEYGNVEYAQGIALSYYQSDSAKNRYKQDKLTQSAEVKLYSFLGNYRLENWTFMGQYVLGHLENSEIVVDANSTLGGLAKPKAFASLGSEAVLRVIQIAYDITDEVTGYAKYEFVNTFFNVAENISELPRYEITYNALGLRWIIDDNSQLKFETGIEKTKLEGLPETKYHALSFVMSFGGLN